MYDETRDAFVMTNTNKNYFKLKYSQGTKINPIRKQMIILFFYFYEIIYNLYHGYYNIVLVKKKKRELHNLGNKPLIDDTFNFIWSCAFLFYGCFFFQCIINLYTIYV